MPSAARRWIEQANKWLDAKRQLRLYLGKPGNDALTFLERVGPWIAKAPPKVSEPDLWAVLERLGGRANSRRWAAAILASFLSWCGNWVVQQSGIRRRLGRRDTGGPVATPEDWERSLDTAVGEERVVLALLWPRRTVEVVRARVRDVHLDRPAPSMDVRQKGGRGEVTDPDVPLSPTQVRELAWYLSLRQRWSQDATVDSGHLVCRWDGSDLVGVSRAFVARRVRAATERAGRRLPPHAFRRGALTYLRDRGVEWDDVRDTALHRSMGTTEIYVKSLSQKRRLPEIARLMDPLAAEGGA